MASFNRVILIGNLTRDPEHKLLPSGQGVCRLGLAVNRQFKNRQTGTLMQEVCYIDIDVWGAQAETCRQYLQKGRPVLVEGRLKYDTWEDQNGQTKNRHTIVADRVLFLSMQGAAALEAEESQRASAETTVTEDSLQLNPNNPIERDLLNQLEKAKSNLQAASKEKVSVKKSSGVQYEKMPAGEIDFQDTPPFEDDLPF